MNNNIGGSTPNQSGGNSQPYASPGQYQQPVQQSPQQQSYQAAPYQPPQYYPQQQPYQPPQYYPQQQPYQPTQYQPPQYYGQPAAYQPPPQYYGQQVQYYAPPGYYPQPVYYVTQEYVNKKLFKKHCSRVGLMLMADEGLMFLAYIIIMIVGVLGYRIFHQKYFPWLDYHSAYVNIAMLASCLAAIVSHMVPACCHAHKWKIKFTEPFRGDKLSKGFILAATATAIGVNAIWGYIYNIAVYFIDTALGVTEVAAESYTPENTPLVAMILMVIWSCVVAPVTEEYLFRGVIMRTLSKHGVTFGIVASAILFGLMHGNMAQTPMTFMIGLIMGYVAAKSGNIRQSIFMHMVNNVLATLPSVVYYFCPQYYDAFTYVYFAMDIITILFAVAALIFFAVRRHKGLKARRLRLQTGGADISKAESNWAKLEIPEEKRRTEFHLVKHKFGNFFVSGGMIFFVVFMLITIFITDFLPYLLLPFSNY